jgi:hypothetical protein
VLDETGARRQESLRENPAMQKVRNIDRLLKGVIQPNGVLTRDNQQNNAGVTMVNITLYGGYPNITNVPIMAKKFNKENGEEMTPDPGDLVLVQFINGNFWEPVVMGFLPLPENEIEATTEEAPPGKRRYHLRCNKTDVAIDKDGNRTTTVTGNDTKHTIIDEALTVDGKRTTIIEGHDATTVTSGDLTISVSAGKCTVHIAGKTAWTSDAGIDLDGGSGSPAGVVQGKCTCAYTGAPHPHISATVKASL